MGKSPSTTDETPPDFERSLKALEDIVTSMERGELSLEESLRRFEQGIGLVRACQQALQAAEQRVQQLTEEDGRTELRPLADAADD